ncbi:hypothetical protein HDU97_005125 [Phlyctochytrium planicorne]|nr:hypothetical protein HDU97_005125 [Phlyctochytrium planicorne]
MGDVMRCFNRYERWKMRRSCHQVRQRANESAIQCVARNIDEFICSIDVLDHDDPEALTELAIQVAADLPQDMLSHEVRKIERGEFGAMDWEQYEFMWSYLDCALSRGYVDNIRTFRSALGMALDGWPLSCYYTVKRHLKLDVEEFQRLDTGEISGYQEYSGDLETEKIENRGRSNRMQKLQERYSIELDSQSISSTETSITRGGSEKETLKTSEPQVNNQPSKLPWKLMDKALTRCEMREEQLLRILLHDEIQLADRAYNSRNYKSAVDHFFG